METAARGGRLERAVAGAYAGTEMRPGGMTVAGARLGFTGVARTSMFFAAK